jgi:hypothetical protein
MLAKYADGNVKKIAINAHSGAFCSFVVILLMNMRRSPMNVMKYQMLMSMYGESTTLVLTVSAARTGDASKRIQIRQRMNIDFRIRVNGV